MLTDLLDICISTGDEITMDYAMSSVNIKRNDWDCLCGSSDCRGRIRGDDWKKFVNESPLNFPFYLRLKLKEQLKK